MPISFFFAIIFTNSNKQREAQVTKFSSFLVLIIVTKGP